MESQSRYDIRDRLWAVSLFQLNFTFKQVSIVIFRKIRYNNIQGTVAPAHIQLQLRRFGRLQTGGVPNMSHYVISISREFGSGGRLIGKRLAARLGIPCYDRALIQKTAEKSGLSPEFIARAEERARSRFHLSFSPIGIGVPSLYPTGCPHQSPGLLCPGRDHPGVSGRRPLCHRRSVQRLRPWRPSWVLEGVYPWNSGRPRVPLCGGIPYLHTEYDRPDPGNRSRPGQLLQLLHRA